MRTLISTLDSHLKSGVTTMCTCWRVTRSDGMVIGFTDHDVAVEFDGVSFEPDSGFSARDATATLGLSIDASEIDGAISSDRLSEADLRAGRYDGAAVDVYRVNWADPTQRYRTRHGTLGPIERSGATFSSTLHGLADRLQAPTGRVYQGGCDAELGDARCGVDLEVSNYKASITVSRVEQQAQILVSGIETHAAGTFTGGSLVFDAGALHGQTLRVRQHMRDQDGDWLILWTTPLQPVSVGATATVRVGCDKSFETCKAKFGNHLNFRGFPHIPGPSFVYGYARQGDPQNTGGSRQ
ncbi:MAG: DUF2163 domain-containing protein [Pseudomonadota bacterium]